MQLALATPWGYPKSSTQGEEVNPPRPKAFSKHAAAFNVTSPGIAVQASIYCLFRTLNLRAERSVSPFRISRIVALGSSEKLEFQVFPFWVGNRNLQQNDTNSDTSWGHFQNRKMRHLNDSPEGVIWEGRRKSPGARSLAKVF